jgi:hypothetical protein
MEFCAELGFIYGLYCNNAIARYVLFRGMYLALGLMRQSAATGGFKGALLPSQSPKFLNDQVSPNSLHDALSANACARPLH